MHLVKKATVGVRGRGGGLFFRSTVKDSPLKRNESATQRQSVDCMKLKPFRNSGQWCGTALPNNPVNNTCGAKTDGSTRLGETDGAPR